MYPKYEEGNCGYNDGETLNIFDLNKACLSFLTCLSCYRGDSVNKSSSAYKKKQPNGR